MGIESKRQMLERVAYSATTSSHCSKSVPFSAEILNPVRATIRCSGPKVMCQMAEWFVRHGAEKLPVVKVKNKFALEDASKYNGYRDLTLYVLYTGPDNHSIIGEVCTISI